MATSFSILLDDDSRFVICEKCQPYYFYNTTYISWCCPFIPQCSIPFSLDDITKTLPVIEVADDDLLPFLHENPSFAFLLQRGEQSFFSHHGDFAHLWINQDSCLGCTVCVILFIPDSKALKISCQVSFIGFWFSLIYSLIVYLYSGFLVVFSSSLQSVLGLYTRG